MNIAIIVAAGSGARFGGETPKQFVEVNGRPLIVHTLARFEACHAIDRIIAVVSADRIGIFTDIVSAGNLSKLSNIVSGGATRAESVRNALLELDLEPDDIVAVHDGARPLVSPTEIWETVELARIDGAACLTARVTETIKAVERDIIVETIDREKLRSALTPQCFRFDILQRAFAPENFESEATDECYLVEKLGVKIACVEGRRANLKVTTREDLFVVESLLKIIQTADGG